MKRSWKSYLTPSSDEVISDYLEDMSDRGWKEAQQFKRATIRLAAMVLIGFLLLVFLTKGSTETVNYTQKSDTVKEQSK